MLEMVGGFREVGRRFHAFIMLDQRGEAEVLASDVLWMLWIPRLFWYMWLRISCAMGAHGGGFGPIRASIHLILGIAVFMRTLGSPWPPFSGWCWSVLIATRIG